MCFICSFILSGATIKSEAGKARAAVIVCINFGFSTGKSTAEAEQSEKATVKIISKANVGKTARELPSNASLADSFILAFIFITENQKIGKR